MTSSRDEIFETQADPDSPQRTARMHERTLDDSRTHAHERASQRLGPYRLVRELARGGMGAVFEVVDERDGRHLALKTIRADLTDPESLDRFRREAQLTAQLDHPNVCRLHHANLDHDPCYLVQDLLTGGTLEQRLRAGPLPPEEARQIALDLGEGLAHAHGLGILHRDLSPRNVMFDAAGQAKIVDFGLARSLATWQRLTVTGQLLGTPAFMAPEQALDSKSADARSDVYGLGGLLYTMLTGAALIPPEARTIPAAVEALLHWNPPAARTLNPQVPADLDAICQRALAKDPLRRFSSMKALVRALAAEPGDSAGGEPTEEPAPRAVWPIVLVTAMAVLVLLGLGYLLGRSKPAVQVTDASASPAPAPSSPLASASPQPTPTASASPSPSPSAGAGMRWQVRPGQRLAYHLTRWLEVGDPIVHASLGVLVQLDVKSVGPEKIQLEGRVVRIRYWIDGPYNLRFDTNNPRVKSGPVGEAQRALRAPIGNVFPVEIDPRSEQGPRLFGVTAALQDPVRALSPKSNAPYDRGWALGWLIESLGRESLVQFFEGKELQFRAGALVQNHRQSLPRPGKLLIERLERVRLHKVRPGESLSGISAEQKAFAGAIQARNGIEAPNLVRQDDVLEIPGVQHRPQHVGVVSLQPASGRAVPVVARPWGVVLAAGEAGWAFCKLREVGPWSELQWGGGTAFVATRHLGPTPKTVALYAVTASDLWVRSTPIMNDPKIKDNKIGVIARGQLYVGDPGKIQNRIWIPIRFDDRKPFVSIRYLKRLPR